MAIANHATVRQSWPSRGQVAIVAAVAAVVLLLVRAPDAFTNPQFYAEDAAVFWLEARRDGVAALVAHYAGYLHTLPRLIAWLGSWFAPALAPAIYIAAAVAVTMWAASTAALAVSNPWMGVCFAVALLIVPNPEGSTIATVVNLQRVMGPVMALLLATPPAAGVLLRRSNAMFVLLAGLSGPFMVFSIPLALWRLHRHRDGLAAIALGAALVQAIVLVFYHVEGRPDFAAIGHWVSLLAVRSLGGSTWAWPFALAIVALAIVSPADREMRLGLLAFMAVLMVSLLVRLLSQPVGLLDPPGNGSRYFYIQHVIVMWCAISLLFGGGWAALAGGLCAAAVIVGSPKFFSRTPWLDMKWREHAAHIGKANLSIPINPQGWTLRVPADRN